MKKENNALKEFIFEEVKKHDNSFENIDNEELDYLLFRNPKTLRLRRLGYQTLRDIFYHSSFKLEESLTGRELLTLKKQVCWPYYLPRNNSTLYLFTAKDSFILKINGGNVKAWLKGLYKKNNPK